MSPDRRPNPDALLEAVKSQETDRGFLKIFFGGCAGVGKTYAMLAAARERLKEGVRVTAGVVETHGRADTKAMMEGIPIIPKQEFMHRGILVDEFDLDAAIINKPDIILLDELAHTNAPGSRHPKRWQDVEELLEAGIDVYTTLNVQHLESLNDIVASITGISVNETVPDSVFDEADDITLVDIPPDELLKRLREGKVYLGQDVRATAAENFFKKSNLIALRELALRRTAERVDAQMEDSRALEGIRHAAAVADRIMVCVGPEPLSARLIRSARRIAKSLKAPWVAVYIENERHYRLNERGKKSVQSMLRMAERIGGKSVVLQGNDAVDEIMSYARAHGINKIIVGKPEKSWWKDLMIGSLVGNLIRASGDDIDVYVITGKSYLSGEFTHKKDAVKFDIKQYIFAVIAVALSTVVGIALQPVFSLKAIDQIMIYLIGSVLVASKFGLGPSILYTLLSVNTYNFFFVEPLYSFAIYERSYWTSLAVMLVTSLVITAQASRLQLQALFARKHERDTEKFYSLARELASTRGHANMAQVAVKNIEETFNLAVAIWMPDKMGALTVIAGNIPDFDEVREMGAVSWCYYHQEMTGNGTMTLPSATGLYFPLFSNTATLGVLGVAAKHEDHIISLEEISSLENYASILVSSFERASAADDAQQAKIDMEKEKLRNVLLSSVSHDLRTPLASIIGSSSSIMNDAAKLSKDTIEQLAKGIHGEARRLSRIVTNLLDVTRLESGDVQINRQPYYVQELVGSALEQLQYLLTNHKIVTKAEDVPMVMADGTLIGQVLVNLLANAAKYTPPDTTITISVARKNDAVQVTIADQGTGIPVGEEKKVFDKFYTINKHKEQKGTGLGLAICHAIIVAHKGEIGVMNNPQGGASFYFTLPIAEAKYQEQGYGA